MISFVVIEFVLLEDLFITNLVIYQYIPFFFLFSIPKITPINGKNRTFVIDGQKTARIGSKYTQNNVAIFLDFLSPDLYLIEIIRTKDVPDRGMEPRYYLMDMAIAVDNKNRINFKAKCAEDETLDECFVPQSKNDELVKLFKKGNEVNFKIGDFDLYFSLSGFSKAFSRASRLVK